MRTLVIAVWAVLCSLLAAVPAVADSPATLPPLAPGEVLLEVSALGVSRTPATSAVLTLRINSTASTREEARRNAAAAAARVVTAARAAGVAAADIEQAPVTEDSLGMDVYNTALTLDPEGNVVDELPPSFTATSAVTVVLRNPAGAAPLASRLRAIEGVQLDSIHYRLDDDRAARRTARGDAIRNARADAEAYAAAMGMRIARLLRVTERTGVDSLPMALTEENPLARGMRDGPGSLGRQSNEDGQIATYAIVGVDYALTAAR
jgi:uncharacterized protein YggE